MSTTTYREPLTRMAFEKKRRTASLKFAAIRNGSGTKEESGHDLSITVLQRLPDGTPTQTLIVPRHKLRRIT